MTEEEKRKRFEADPVEVGNIQSYVNSYGSAFGGETDFEKLVDILVEQEDWTSKGAAILLDGARRHGAFMLRSMLAIAVVLQIEDGTDGQ